MILNIYYIQFFKECTQFCIFYLMDKIIQWIKLYSIYIFFERMCTIPYIQCSHFFSNNVNNYVYSHFQILYTVLYSHYSLFFKKRIQFWIFYVHIFSNSVQNYIHLMYTFIYIQYTQFSKNAHNFCIFKLHNFFIECT